MEFRKLDANEIDVRIGTIAKDGKGLSLLLYKDARCDMNILDEAVGPENWQRKHEVINGNLFCNVGIFVNNQWVWKQDVGTESYTEKEKGQASDSFKRACFNWGIGRELYTAPFIWFSNEDANIKNNKCYDKFVVEEIKYDGNVISELKVTNNKTGKTYYYSAKKKNDNFKKTQAEEITENSSEPVTEENINELISENEYNMLNETINAYNRCNEQPINEQKMLKHFKVESFMMITKAQYLVFMKQLNKGIK